MASEAFEAVHFVWKLAELGSPGGVDECDPANRLCALGSAGGVHDRGFSMVIRAAVLTVIAVLTFAAPAAAQEPPPWLQFEGGATAAQFDFARAIEEVVYVESELDSDRDGARDLIRVRISRPREPAERGDKVPVIFEHSPYRGDTGPAINHAVDFDSLPQEEGTGVGALRQAETARGKRSRRGAGAGPRADLPGSLDNYFVPRGYAVVLGESVGTFNSQGCPDVGATGETLGTKAAIDWLNGRARGFDVAGAPVSAAWSTGDVGMVGTSYNGTLPNQVATTGVEGLKTIIPARRSRPGMTTIAPTASSSRLTLRQTGWGRMATRARTPTCSAITSAVRGCSSAASAASCTTTCWPSRTV